MQFDSKHASGSRHTDQLPAPGLRNFFASVTTCKPTWRRERHGLAPYPRLPNTETREEVLLMAEIRRSPVEVGSFSHYL